MIKTILIAPIKLYQFTLSKILPRACRYEPSCSVYTVQCIEKFGAKGLLLGFWRILHCNPFGGCGYDPVPDTFTFKRKNNTDCKE